LCNRSHDHYDFSASWPTGYEWRVIEAWSAMDYWRWLVTFLYLFEAAIVSSQAVVMFNWKENQDLAGYEFTQNIIFVYNTNELRCAARCSFDSQCISWTYSGSNCIGYNSIFTGLGNSLLSGTARYYIRHDCGRYLFFLNINAKDLIFHVHCVSNLNKITFAPLLIYTICWWPGGVISDETTLHVTSVWPYVMTFNSHCKWRL
jgi:hypothetical protein